MAIAISGVVIVSQKPFVYKKKCEFCGYVLPGTTSGAAPHKHSTLNGGFVCPKCNKKVPLIIKGE